MTESYTEFVELADELITEFGREVRLLSTTRDSANSATPWNGPLEWDDATAAVEKMFDITAVFIGSRLALTQGQIAGRLRSTVDPFLTNQTSDIFLVSGSCTQDLSQFTKLIDGEQVWKIDQVTTIKPGSVVVLYAIQVSK